MKISVTIRRLINEPDKNLKATASVTLDDQFVIRYVKIYKRADNDGYWVGFPGFRHKQGRGFVNTCHPITQEFRERFDEAVIDAYFDAIKALEEVVL